MSAQASETMAEFQVFIPFCLFSLNEISIYQVAETCILAESTNPFEFFILLSLYITVSAHFHFNIFLKSIYFFSWPFPLYRLKLSPF